MKKITILFTLFTFFTTIGFSQQLEEKVVALYCNSSLLEKFLQEREIDFVEIDEALYKIELNGYNVLVSMDEGDIHLHSYFTINNPSLIKINDFNYQYMWGRCYLDTDGHLVLQSSLSFTGGMSFEGIIVFLNTYGKLLDRLASEMQ